MDVRISLRELRVAWAVAALASIALVAATAYTNDFWARFGGGWHAAPFPQKLLTFMDLGAENNIGAWFSSMLLATIMWVAVLCFLVDGARGKKDWLRYGWLLIAAGFAALSFDELGSAHERLDLPDGYLGAMLWYLPIMALLPVYMLAFGFSRMRSDPLAIGLIGLGCLCFATIPAQEYFETAIRAGSPRPILELALEEGTELAGMLAFLAAFFRYCAVTMREPSVKIAIEPRWFWGIWSATFLMGLVSREIASVLLTPDELSGNCRNWFPSFAAYLAALLAWYTAGAAQSPFRKGAALGVAALFLGASLIAGSQIGAFERILAFRFGTPDMARTVLVVVAFASGLWLSARPGAAGTGTAERDLRAT